MAINSGTAGIALLLVSILGLAAVGGAVVTNPHDCENPDGILGVYTVAEYTQGGIGPDGEWHWYETGDGTYDGETIILERYEGGFVKGMIYLNNEKYALNGFYEPYTGTFGYASYYDYTPESGGDVIDIIYGYIDEGVMILTGYTVSVQNATQAYTYAFIFVKNGASYISPFYDNGFASISFSESYVLDSATEKETQKQETVEYSVLDYRNGVYMLSVNGVLESATTIYQNWWEDSIALLGLCIKDGAITEDFMSIQWMGYRSYVFSCDLSEPNVCKVLKDDTMPYSDPKTGVHISPISILSSTDREIREYNYSIRFSQDKSFSNSFSIIAYNDTLGTKLLINQWPDNQLTARGGFSLNGTYYNYELFGCETYDGDYLFYGFVISDSGEISVIKEKIPM